MVAATMQTAAITPAGENHRTLRLENGDHLTRAEFERRYAAMPDMKKAELVEGMVIMPSPTRHQHHAVPHNAVATWLGVYSAAAPGTEVSNNVSLRIDQDNELQPDVLLRIVEAAGGSSHVADDDYLEGAPELIAEIAASSASYDYHVKRHVYRRNGVREYLIWRVDDGVIDWFSLEESEYVALPADDAGVIRSKVFPGLWLATKALLAGDLATVLATLQQGLQSEAHAGFIATLRSK
ncbi:MAG: Uma2 family endonuclease [Caldilinea sp.]